MKNILASLFIVARFTELVSAQEHLEYKHFGEERKRDEAPNFALKDIHGKTVHLSDYRGKVVLLYFWKTTAPYAPTQLKMMIELQKQYAKSGLQCIAVAFDSSGAKTVKPVSEELGIFFPSLVAGHDLIKQYQLTDFYFPAGMIIDKKGGIFSQFTDIERKTKSWIERWIMILLNE
jgi:peroxiredoxin